MCYPRLKTHGLVVFLDAYVDRVPGACGPIDASVTAAAGELENQLLQVSGGENIGNAVSVEVHPARHSYIWASYDDTGCRARSFATVMPS